MNIRYYFAVCVIILGFSSIVKASDRTFFQEETSVITDSTVLKTNMFFDNQVDALLTKVIINTYSGNHDVFWKNLVQLFHKFSCVYISLGTYLYNSIFSIFNW
ncbi:hypothetical protein GCM10023262_16030 [Bartonella pachyuromydis]|uniref:Uncharacterized protein n=1 Tax=Bartonella pachyuromydis TaxID=931097 RepID=A0ABP8VN26_9HYPH